jgi:hypothetical protein
VDAPLPLPRALISQHPAPVVTRLVGGLGCSLPSAVLLSRVLVGASLPPARTYPESPSLTSGLLCLSMCQDALCPSLPNAEACPSQLPHLDLDLVTSMYKSNCDGHQRVWMSMSKLRCTRVHYSSTVSGSLRLGLMSSTSQSRQVFRWSHIVLSDRKLL